jgi:hypothetical protein
MPSFFSSTARAKKSLKSLAMGSKTRPENEDLTPLDCIFACSVCGDVFSDVYQQHDTVHGLSDGINPKERIVTRLYVTSCCHVICIKHIEGGNGESVRALYSSPANDLQALHSTKLANSHKRPVLCASKRVATIRHDSCFQCAASARMTTILRYPSIGSKLRR